MENGSIPAMFDAIVISVHKYDSHQDAALDLLGRDRGLQVDSVY